MTTITLLTGQVSQVTFVPAGSRITSSGSGSIEWMPGTPTDATNSTNWSTWAKGSTAGYMDTLRAMSIRATATGSMTVTIEEGRGDKYVEDAYFDADYPTISTDANGNMVLISGNTQLLALNSHLISISSTTLGVPQDIATKLEIDTVRFDSHGLADKANNVIENPYYGVSTCYVRGFVNFGFAAASGTYRYVALETGETTALGSELYGKTLSAAVDHNLLVPIISIPSTVRYIGAVVAHDVAATSTVTHNLNLDIFV